MVLSATDVLFVHKKWKHPRPSHYHHQVWHKTLCLFFWNAVLVFTSNVEMMQLLKPEYWRLFLTYTFLEVKLWSLTSTKTNEVHRSLQMSLCVLLWCVFGLSPAPRFVDVVFYFVLLESKSLRNDFQIDESLWFVAFWDLLHAVKQVLLMWSI